MTWIQTHTSKKFDYDAPTVAMVNIYDITHSLAHQCRFTGHTRKFYSVAQHSYLLSYRVPEDQAFSALMHDAHEAYIGDLCAPMKVLLPDYRNLENRIAAVVREKFDLPPTSDAVKLADRRLCYAELLALFGSPMDYTFNCEPMNVRIIPWTERVAKTRFLYRYNELRS